MTLYSCNPKTVCLQPRRRQKALSLESFPNGLITVIFDAIDEADWDDTVNLGLTYRPFMIIGAPKISGLLT